MDHAYHLHLAIKTFGRWRSWTSLHIEPACEGTTCITCKTWTYLYFNMGVTTGCHLSPLNPVTDTSQLPNTTYQHQVQSLHDSCFFKRISTTNSGHMYVTDHLSTTMIVLLHCSKSPTGTIYDYKHIYPSMFYAD